MKFPKFRWLRSTSRDTPDTEERGWVSALSVFRDPSRMEPNWFQKGVSPPSQTDAMSHAGVAACVTILSQEVARLRVEHYQTQTDGSRKKLQGSAVSRVLNRPNHYQTRSDFNLNLMRNLLLSGNAYAIAERNAQGTVIALHPRPSTTVQPWVIPDTGDIFYSVLDSDLDTGSLVDMVNASPDKYLVPARNVLHVKLDTPGHPLVGVTPLTGCQYAVPQGIAIQRDSTSFFSRMSRPSGVLTTPKKLGKDAAKRLKEMWESGMADNFQGRTAVLDNELKWEPLTMSAGDSQLIEQYSMTVRDIAMVYRIPLFMLGDLTKATLTNAEAMQKTFQAGSLGFYTEHIEAALDQFFEIKSGEYIEFDMERGIVRTELETRTNAHAKSVISGLMTINEARALDHRPPVEGGDETYLQRQNWPINLLGADAVEELQDVTDGGGVDDDETDDEDKAFIDSTITHLKLYQGGRK